MKTKAFTLIEMLSVLAIGVILLAVVLPIVQGAISTAQQAKMAQNLKQLQNIVLAYDMEQGTGWPGTNSWETWMENMAKRYSEGQLKEIASGPEVKVTQFPPEKSAIRVYSVRQYDPEDVVLASSYNWNASSPSALQRNAIPFSDRGFVVVYKDGSAKALKPEDAESIPHQFQPGMVEGNPSP